MKPQGPRLQHILTRLVRLDEQLAEPGAARRSESVIGTSGSNGKKAEAAHFFRLSVPRTSWLSSGILTM